MSSFIRKLIETVNNCIPKNRHYIFLRSTFVYQDNMQAILDCILYDHLNKEYTIFCNGLGFETYKGEKNVKLLKMRGLDSFWAFARSKYVIHDNGIFMNPKVNCRQVLVNTWHGVSFKKIGFYNMKEEPYRTASYIVTYSDFYKPIMAKAFGVPEGCVLTTGEPRNDYLFKPASNDTLKKLNINLDGDKKLIIWMPTYRKSKFEDKSDGKEYELGIPILNKQNIEELDSYCKENKIVLLMKWHSLQVIPDNMEKRLTNIKFLTTDEIAETKQPFYSILARSDGLITDYSSVFINYLLLNRQICFAYDDIDYYRNNRGFMFDDIESLMPGPHVSDVDGLKEFISNVANNRDEYGYEREKVNKLLNEHTDNENAKRLLDALGIKGHRS